LTSQKKTCHKNLYLNQIPIKAIHAHMYYGIRMKFTIIWGSNAIIKTSLKLIGGIEMDVKINYLFLMKLHGLNS
jgi:hypothetical protein